MRLIIRDTSDAVADWVANYVKDRILAFNPTPQRPFVLGLCTGRSPKKTYSRLVQFYRNGELSFQNVVTFNIDEYLNLDRDHTESYHSYMWNNFFSKIDINPVNANMLNGNAPKLLYECQRYEKKIQSYGGIELFLGGVAEDGHIGFNEPGSSLTSRTRVKTIAFSMDSRVISKTDSFKGDISQAPTMALTVGVGTIMDAKEVLIIVTGNEKANALSLSVEGDINHMHSLSALQMHRKTILVCDDDATSNLRRTTVRYFKHLEKVAATLPKSRL